MIYEAKTTTLYGRGWIAGVMDSRDRPGIFTVGRNRIIGN